MSYDLFVAYCPIGLEIRLDCERFENHIINRHPEMVAHVDLIKESIVNPDYIVRSKQFYTSYLYLIKKANAKRNGTYYTTIVRQISDTAGLIVTSFIQSGYILGEEGELVYEKNNDAV